MRNVLIAVLLAAAPLAAQSGWTLVWHDEFDEAAIDTTKWGYDTGTGYNGWGNNELEYYTSRPENSYLQNGQLLIKAIHEDYGGRHYTSARMLTMGKFAQKYGRIEARIKIPYGQGIWPAFWMLGDDINTAGWPSCGEIDIMENVGKEPAHAYGTIHGPITGSNSAYSIGGMYALPGSGRLADDFHVYAVEWEPAEVRFYVDGTLYETVKSSDLAANQKWVFDHPFFIILNVAVGGNWPGSPDNDARISPFPQIMYVDYVRVYDRAAAGAAPVISSERGVVNGASFEAGFAPGSWVSIGGTGLASTTRTWRAEDFDGGNLPTALDGVSVTFNGKPAYVEYVSPTQINVQAPDTGPGPVQVEVLAGDQLSERVTAQASAASPAFFLWPGSYAVATHLDYSMALKAGVYPIETLPAHPGEWITLWGTGFGPTDLPVRAGQVVDTAQHNVVNAPAVTINGEQAPYYGAALTSNNAGLYQITVQVPSDMPDGDWPVVATLPDGSRSPDNVYLTVAK